MRLSIFQFSPCAASPSVPGAEYSGVAEGSDNVVGGGGGRSGVESPFNRYNP